MSSTSIFSSSSSDGGVPTSAVPNSSSKSGTSSATLLFSFLVVFVALFTAFLLLGFFWNVRRGRRQAMLLEFDEARGTYKGVPEMWEVWIQDEPSGSQWEWKEIRPLSVDVDRAPILPGMSATPRPRSRLRIGLRNPFSPRRAPTSAQGPHGGTVVEPTPPPPPPPPVPIEGVRMSFIIAMPYAGVPSRRRSEISTLSRAGENWRQREYAIGTYHPPFREEGRAPQSS